MGAPFRDSTGSRAMMFFTMRSQSVPSSQPVAHAGSIDLSERESVAQQSRTVMALSKSHIVVALEEQANPLWEQREQGTA